MTPGSSLDNPCCHCPCRLSSPTPCPARKWLFDYVLRTRSCCSRAETRSTSLTHFNGHAYHNGGWGSSLTGHCGVFTVQNAVPVLLTFSCSSTSTDARTVHFALNNPPAPGHCPFLRSQERSFSSCISFWRTPYERITRKKTIFNLYNRRSTVSDVYNIFTPFYTTQSTIIVDRQVIQP